VNRQMGCRVGECGGIWYRFAPDFYSPYIPNSHQKRRHDQYWQKYEEMRKYRNIWQWSFYRCAKLYGRPLAQPEQREHRYSAE
jgi:hypothetical protein